MYRLPVNCPHCSKPLVIEDPMLLGKSVACPLCRKPVQLPDLDQANVEVVRQFLEAILNEIRASRASIRQIEIILVITFAIFILGGGCAFIVSNAK